MNFCFPLSQALNFDDWEKGLHQHDAAKFGRYMQFRGQLRNAIREYDIPVIELKKDNAKEAVCIVFEKVNTGGVAVSVFELVTATYAADGVNLRDEWYGNRDEGKTGLRTQLRQQRLLQDVLATDFLQGLSLLHTYDQRRADLEVGKTGKQATPVSAKRDGILNLPPRAYHRWSQPLLKGFWTAAKFLRKEAFFSHRDIPYRTQLVPLACALTMVGDRWLDQDVHPKVARWFWSGVLGELYGGAVETRIALDLQQLMDWVDGAADEPKTVRDANFQPGRLDTLRSRNSAAYKGVHVLVQRAGAMDWFWRTTIRELEPEDWEDNNIDIHHVFPRKWCREQGIDQKSYDSILNKVPVSSRANRIMSGDAPSDYLARIEKKSKLPPAELDALLASHSLEPGHLRANDYDAFRESRRAMLLARIADVMGKPPQETGEAVPDDELEDAEREDAAAE